MQFNIIRLQDYKKMLWKNGKGFTYEVAKDELKEPYDWRISMAEIKENGSFSNFSGYQRIISVLNGQGIQLEIDGDKKNKITKFTTFTFSGDSETYCSLLGDPVEDFNLIYNPEKISARFQWLDLSIPQAFCSQAQKILTFSATKNVSIRSDNFSETLNKFDSMFIDDNQKLTQIEISTDEPAQGKFCCIIELSGIIKK